MIRNTDTPPAQADPFARACVHYITHRATEIRATTALEHRLAGALARYWLHKARKAASH